MTKRSEARTIVKNTAKIFGINRMTVSRWLKKGELSNCYKRLLSKPNNHLSGGKDPINNILEIEDALQSLVVLKNKFGSWQEVADWLDVDKKTVMRWRKTNRISLGYRKLLYYLLKETPNIN